MAQVYKGAGTAVAKLPGVQPLLDKGAREILGRARAQASRHMDTGAYFRSLQAMAVPGKKGVMDRIVYSDDPAAIPIEFGYVQGGKYHRGKRFLRNALYG